MESSYSGGTSEAEDSSNLSIQRKRELVNEMFENTDDARELLQSWTRRELIQLICFESGKERKYAGLPKPKMINRLLKIISRKSTAVNFVRDANKELLRSPKDATFERSVTLSEDEDSDQERNLDELADTNVPNGLKRKAAESKLKDSGDKDAKIVRPKRKVKDAKLDQLLCENVACRATLSMGDVYCKRCSCCICCKFDDNKDPSLWLVCSSDPPFTDESCGATCHLKCALKHEKSGIRKKTMCSEELDGAFYCVFCGKVNSLLGCLRKQLTAAISARRVDALCERLFLSNKILNGTELYKEIGKTVSVAVAKLKKEVGPLDKVSAANARGIVNRLNCGPEVQKLCVSVMEALDQMLGCLLKIETRSPGPKHIGPAPSTKYQKACPLSKESELDTWETKCITRNLTGLSYPGLRKEPTRDMDSQKGSTNSSENYNLPPKNASVVSLPHMVSNSCALKVVNNKPMKTDMPILVPKNEMAEQRYEYCVRVIRWLEHEGYMQRDLRVKFLTWFSVKATAQDRRVVNTFIDVLLDDPASLVAQLLDAFMDGISGKEKPVDRRVLLAKLWH